MRKWREGEGEGKKGGGVKRRGKGREQGGQEEKEGGERGRGGEEGRGRKGEKRNYRDISSMIAPPPIYRVKDGERRYKNRESKPEDLELIRELKLLKEQHTQRIKDLIVSIHVQPQP